ncbi:IS1182 family transposase [Deinococcus multiflagellatus]|uniref:IS1182 family transposase n=1 Tax=Deinococcus multiflagellatus TaxID=1656887 RepID=A0ABW1ZN92_9DEIO|nr:IS1182 family transposase [Deinococcus multiflagellatus]MBZ9716170.1 IS1182 family transposase [Deinococcus multiflagellatus]
MARAAFRKGNLYLRIRDELGALFQDSDFETMFSTTGRPGVAPWRLALVTVFQFLEDLPDRQAADAVRSRLDWKYALGLELTDSGFDFSLLSDFRARLMDHEQEGLLLDILVQKGIAQGWIKVRGKQRTDSTHVIGAVRRLTRLELLGETMRAAMNELAKADPDWLRPLLTASLVKRYGHRIEEGRLPRGEAKREQYAADIGQEGFALLEQLDQEKAAHLRELPAVQTLRLIWSQQFLCDVEGKALRWVAWTDAIAASERPASPYDPDTRWATKGETKWHGYRVHLSETCEPDQPELITHVHLAPAPQHDSQALPDIHTGLIGHGMTPADHLVDSGYMSAGLLTSSQKQGIALIGPPRQRHNWQERTEGAFTHRDFRIDWERHDVLCPQGFLNKSWVETVDAVGTPVVLVQFRRRTCERCEVRARCTKADRNKGGRNLLLRRAPEFHALQAARDAHQNGEHALLYALRSGIEATMSQSVRRCDLRHARYRGHAAMRLQALGTAAALNLLRLDGWRQGIPRGKTRVARFVKLIA